MAGFDYQVTGFAYQGAGEFVYQGTSGTPPATINYGLTAGPALGGADGLTLIKANGLGTGALQGIPQDAP